MQVSGYLFHDINLFTKSPILFSFTVNIASIHLEAPEIQYSSQIKEQKGGKKKSYKEKRNIITLLTCILSNSDKFLGKQCFGSVESIQVNNVNVRVPTNHPIASKK